MGKAPVWRISSPGAVSWREWGGEAVLYDDRTGATHRLGVAASSVWQTLAGAAGGADDVTIAQALEFAGLADSGSAPDLVATVLDELERRGLVDETA